LTAYLIKFRRSRPNFDCVIVIIYTNYDLEKNCLVPLDDLQKDIEPAVKEIPSLFIRFNPVCLRCKATE